MMSEGGVSREAILNQVRELEQRFAMTSEEFMQTVIDGTAPDTFETTAWAIMLRHCQPEDDLDVPLPCPPLSTQLVHVRLKDMGPGQPRGNFELEV